MRIKMKYFLAVIPMFFFSTSFAVAEEIRYENLFDKYGAVLGMQADSVRVLDVLNPATKCALTDEYACVISKVFVFSVPRNGKDLKSWTHAGATYTVLRKQEKWILGEKIEYRVIQQRWKRLKIEYAYSDEYGVFAIKASNGHELIHVDGKCGFAAISDKYGCQSNELKP